MARTRILLLDAFGLTAFRCEGSAAMQEEAFAHPGELGPWLTTRRRDRHLLLIDLADESFEALDIPHARGRDRAALVARKLAKHCPGTSLSAALRLARQEAGRGDEQIVCAAINCPHVVEPWLRAMDEAGVIVAGVHSLAQVVPLLPLGGKPDNFLALTLTRAGLRQTFVARGRLRFSRLTAVLTGNTPALADACREQALNIHRHLRAQHLAEHGAPLRVLVLAHRDVAEILRTRCADVGDLKFEFLDPGEIARQCRLSTEFADSRLDALFAHQLARRSPREQFTPAPLRRRWQLKRMGRTIDALGWIALAASCCFVALNAVHVGEVQQNIERLAQQNEAYREQRDATRAASRLTPDQRSLVAAYRDLRRISPPPRMLLSPLATAMDGFPSVSLSRLDWQIASAADGTGSAFAVLEVHGVLPAQPGVTEEALPRLMQRLASPTLDVRMTKQPFAMPSDRALQDADLVRQDSGFALRISRPL